MVRTKDIMYVDCDHDVFCIIIILFLERVINLLL